LQEKLFQKLIGLTKIMIMKNIILISLYTLIVASSNAQNNQTISVFEFAKAIKAKDIQLLDVRTKEEFDNGHIAKSLQADWKNPAEFKTRTDALNKEKTIYIYCLSGSRSAAAATQLRENGFKVIELNGGITAWNSEKLPTEGKPKEKGMDMKKYQTLVASKETVLVVFSAKWCPPCVKMTPTLDMFAKHMPDVKIVKIDADIDKDVISTLSVQSLPTCYLYVKGQKNKVKEGIMTMRELHQFVE
jgi:rhodanese-related sulfurtransferase